MYKYYKEILAYPDIMAISNFLNYANELKDELKEEVIINGIENESVKFYFKVI